METEPTSSIQLPPGFMFHPSDEELIVHYLQNKATSRPLPASVIAEVDLYKYNPWELPKKALFGEDDWYFFSPRNRKYPNGARPNRAASSGYWKATGTDKPILTSCGSKHIGVKKALVFYTGRPSKGAKTEWIMNEYRLLDTNHKPSRLKGSMRLDDWVLCRVRQKSNISRNSCSSMELPRYLPQIEEVRSTTFTNYNNDIITDFQFKGCQVLASILATSQALNPPIDTISCVSFEGSNKANSFTPVYGDGSNNVNYPTIVSSFDDNFNLLKRKSNVENKYEILLSKKKLNSENETKDLLPSKAPAEYDINCYSQNQSQDNFFNLKLSDTITNFQELNEFTFTEKYLQY